MDGITRGKIRLSGRQTSSFQLFMRLIVGRAVTGRGGMTILQASWRERIKSVICGHKKPKPSVNPEIQEAFAPRNP